MSENFTRFTPRYLHSPVGRSRGAGIELRTFASPCPKYSLRGWDEDSLRLAVLKIQWPRPRGKQLLPWKIDAGGSAPGAHFVRKQKGCVREAARVFDGESLVQNVDHRIQGERHFGHSGAR